MNTNHAIMMALTLASSSASAITITLDYSAHDNSFFDGSANGLAAKAAVAKAAADISAAITTNLNAVTTHSFSGVDGGANFTIDSNLSFSNPDGGGTTNFTGPLLANEFKIFVGAQALSGTTAGQGGPGGTGFSSSGAGFSSQAQVDTLLLQAHGDLNTMMGRGASFVSSTTVTDYGNVSTGNQTQNYAPTLGNLWFDKDGTTNWHYDSTTAVAAGKTDLYSVALHEILHALGIGIYDAWDAATSGTEWTGAEAIAANGGSGTGLIAAGGAHIANGTMSVLQSDGTTAQETVMDPDILSGTRKELTELDLAFLRDLGWETVAPVPEPSSALLIGLGSFALILRRRK